MKKTSKPKPALRKRPPPGTRSAADPLIGRRAPDFSLPDQDGNTIRLATLRGRPVVIYFYPKDFTPGCTREACAFRDAWDRVRGTGTEVLGISPDDPGLHARFAREYRLPFRLLSDGDRAVCRKYGVIGRKTLYGRVFTGLIRSTFLVDKQGVVRRAWRGVKVDGHVAVVLDAVRKEL